jgi:HK97 family phage portal protein
VLPSIRRIWSSVVGKTAEGQPRPGPWLLPVSGGFIPANWPWNYWQSGYDPLAGDKIAIVEASISAYSQTVAMCPGDHWQMDDNGGQQRVKTSAASRLLRKPNAYQTPSDFWLNAIRQLYAEGNAYALALRNDRFEPTELHLFDPRSSGPMVAVDGSIFYHLAGNEVIERQFATLSDNPLAFVPARDILHIRLHTSRNMLKGETPLASAQADLVNANMLASQQTVFTSNAQRPSGLLTTDQSLNKDQLEMLRGKWDEQAKGLNQGGVPIVSSGLKWQAISVNAHDAQLIDQLKLNEQHISLAFRMPLQILGIGGTPFASTESLMNFWISTGLGFCLNHAEEAVGKLFGLRGWPDDYIAFDTDALLRSNFKERMEGLARAVQGAILSPNEARGKEGYGRVPFGDDPRMQQQMVPLSYGAHLQPHPPGSEPGPTPPSDAPGTSSPDPSTDGGDGGDSNNPNKDYEAMIMDAVRQYEQRIHTE